MSVLDFLNKDFDADKAANDYVESLNDNGFADNTAAMSHCANSLDWINPTEDEAKKAVDAWVDKLPSDKNAK